MGPTIYKLFNDGGERGGGVAATTRGNF